MPWWGWVIVIVLVIVLGTLNVIGWFGDDDNDDITEDDEEDYARLIYDLRTEIQGLTHELAMMEREGVIEGIYEFSECGYWRPTREEAEAFREEYPGRVSQEDIDEIYGDGDAYVLRGGL